MSLDELIEELTELRDLMGHGRVPVIIDLEETETGVSYADIDVTRINVSRTKVTIYADENLRTVS